MNLPANILHGRRDMPISDLETAPNRKGLDAVRRRYIAQQPDAYVQDEEGRLSRFPGFSSMFIDEVRSSEKLRGELYEFDLKGTGLLDGKDKWIYGPKSQPTTGWDSQTVTVYTRTPDALLWGMVHPTLAQMWAEDRETEREIGDIHRVVLGFKGMIPIAGNAKPYKRQIGVNSATMASSQPLKAWVRQVDGSYVLDTAGKYYNFESPRVQVVDTYLSTTAPDTANIPGSFKPPSAPAVKKVLASLTDGDPVVPANFFGVTEFTINVPEEWVLKSISAEKHAHADIWLISRTCEYIRPTDPRI